MTHTLRRLRLLKLLDRPLLLMAGGLTARNYPANPVPYRADSTFLYFFGHVEPEAAALLDPADASVTLFLPARTVDDAVWHGAQSTFEQVQEAEGVSQVLPLEQLETFAQKKLGSRPLDALAVSDFKATARAARLCGQPLDFDDPAHFGRPQALQAIASLRLRKEAAELEAMAFTAEVTRSAHLTAIEASRPGVTEQELTGLVEGTFARAGCVPAYNTILSVRGEVLHNHSHRGTLHAGDIVLLDGGAEGPTGYCSDVTRCWPVGGPFTPEGRDVYDLVLAANLAAVAAVKPGVRYRDVHLTSARVIAQGLQAMGLLFKGSVDGLVEAGAHAMFYPHGVGHQIGLDVHDLEPFGDQVLYPGGRARSPQFGTRFLRMDMDLEEGMTFTIEPGVYFVPAIIHSREFRQQFRAQVDFDKADHFLQLNSGRGFGGIRLEDDVLCTSSGARVLTAAIPRARADIEALCVS